MRTGFSLVELSIVLVILGLLVGGILAGQSLIRAAELRSISNDVSRYMAAHHAFRDKYFGLAGDITNATSFWGALHATPNTCATMSVTGTATCNGSGDGKIFSATGAYYDEVFHYWVHLVNAGLIEGRFTGLTTDTSNLREHTPGTNSPQSRIANAGYAVWNGSGITPSAFSGRNMFTFGSIQADTLPLGGAITGAEQWNLDTKMDDGLPQYGKLQALGACIASATAYVLNSTAKDCAFAYVQQ